MKEKNTSYLRRYDDILSEIAEKEELEVEEIENIVDHFFRTFKDFITDDRIPTIKISNLGTFKPSLGVINWQIRLSARILRRKNLSDARKEKFREKIKKLWAVRNRLIKEGNRESTWKEWRNKKL